MLDSNVSTYIDKDGNVQEVGSGGTVDADTLNGLLSGGNGIAIAKNAAGDKVEVGISRSGFELGTSSTDRTGIEFVCNSTTQTINFISLDGDRLLICNMMDSTRSSIILLGSSGEGTMIAYNDMMYTPDSSSSEVKHYLREGNVKTLFGNQSIYGSGNIDLYRHIVWIHNNTSGHKVYITVHVISSSNTPIDSLTDLFTVLSDYANEWYPCNGRVELNSTDRGVAYNFNARSTSNGAIAFLRADGTERYYEWAAHSTGLYVSDKITTV